MSSQKSMTIIYDKQAITRIGIATLVGQKAPFSKIVFVSSKEQLVDNLIVHPNSLVILDYTLSDINSSDGLLNISARFQNAHWILFSEELSVLFLRKVILTSDMFSVVLKTSEADEISSAINNGIQGISFVCPQVDDLLNVSNKDQTPMKEVLTLTEHEVLKEIVLGNKAKEIAANRNISIHTVITHRKNIYRKLSINNAQELTRYALRAGVIDVSEYHI